MPLIARVQARPLDVELIEPFGIATGAQTRAANVLVRVELDDGTAGLGEAAPFPAVSGETQSLALAEVARVAPALTGARASRWRALARQLDELGPCASARCAIETAVADALARRAGASLWELFGGAEASLVTDLTVTTGGVEAAERAARAAAAKGFATIKVKVGGAPFDEDVRRLRAIAGAAPAARLLLDANAALEASVAVALVASLGAERRRVVLFEQPTAAADLEGLRRVREAGLRVAADESARSPESVRALARERAVDTVNLKIMKSGLFGALEMAACARALGLGLMIGGMVETRLAMTVSACLAGGLGGFEEIDLDTPFFLGDDGLTGGFAVTGSTLRLDTLGRGHGVDERPGSPEFAPTVGEW